MAKRNKPKVSTRIQRKPIDVEDIVKAFNPPMMPVQTSMTYRFSLFFCATLMILMPLSYLALIGGIAYYMYDHYQTSESFGLTGWIGSLVIFFLVKPIFSHEDHEYKPITLDRHREPIFFAYIDRICEITGAPKPKRINIDCQLNAAASFHNGFLSFFNKDLDLHLGLPLIVGLDTRQLTGVLTHEFGHFSQGFGMRAYYVINRVNMWFARVVYQRDGFDYWLERIAHTLGSIHILPFLFMCFIRLLIWTSRSVLWIFMHIAHLFSSLLSRQMEFDADRYAMNMVGNSDFINTLKFIPVIDYAQQGAMADLNEAWREKRLGDNIPALVYNNIKRIPQDIQKKMINQGMTHNTSLYDSHPCTSDRIRNGMGDISKGIMLMPKRPASDLFREFESICKNVTLSLYRDGYNIDLKAGMLMETSQLIANVEQEEANRAAYQRYFQGQWGYNPLFPMKKYTVSGDIPMDKLQRELSRTHDAFQQQIDELAKIGKRLDELDVRINDLQDALLLKRSGFSFDLDLLKIPSDTTAGIQSALRQAKEEHESQSALLKPMEDTLIKRIAITYKMLQHPEAADMIEDCASVCAEYQFARQEMMDLSDHIHLITRLRYNWCGLNRLSHYFESQAAESQHFWDTVNDQLKNVRKDLVDIKSNLAHMNYPFEHAGGQELSVADYLIDEIPSLEYPEAIFNTGEQCISNYMALYHRLVGTISITGEAMEEACDLPRIENVQDEEDLPF